MLEILPETKDNFVAVKVKSSLTDADYKDIFIPEMDKRIKQYGKIDVLFVFDADFETIKWGAVWDDCWYGLKHRKHFNRVAIVGGPKWVQWFEAIGTQFTTSELRFFKEGEYQEALHWVHPVSV